MALTLSPHALTTVTRLKAHLDRSSIGEDDVSDRCIAAINAATSWMEMRTARALKARNWRTAVSTQVNTTLNSTSLELADASVVYEGDDIVLAATESACIPAGSSIVSVNSSDSTAVCSNAATAALTQVAVSVGSVPLVCDGTGDSVLYAPEWPIHTLWAAYEVDSAGNRTQLNTTSARIDAMSGRIELPYAIFVEGEQNIELECRAGYVEPTAYERGHSEHWWALERLCLRLAEIFYSDSLSLRGRTTDLTMGGVSARVNDFAMPDDVRADIWPYVRTR